MKRTDLCPHRSYIPVGERQEEKNKGRKERVKEKGKKRKQADGDNCNDELPSLDLGDYRWPFLKRQHFS